ncbi:hypothetical protein EUX98_g3946 [Antrodiella citrinella]|uniref:Uncharacterized protein n=1 Tax=Antrodiella citrinella TaxID=2447956 RepID=A0A4S4MV96_9APHY|nr:hypothetical protein EUX98_g3946 [Antrodiella citrinella]
MHRVLRFQIQQDEPEPLLPKDSVHQPLRTRPVFNRRVYRFLLLTLVLFASLAALSNVVKLHRAIRVSPESTSADRDESPLPPLYEDYYMREKQLPQHDPDLPYPEGRTGKYIAMENIVVLSGWGNAMQELLLDAHVAYKSGRSFVFHPYTWNSDGSNYTKYGDHLIPSKVPLTAILSGPAAGSAFPESSQPAPRAVVKSYFDEVCPHPTVISTHNVTDYLPSEVHADVLVDAWIQKLNSIEDNCVLIDRYTSDHLFTFWIFGDASRILPIWPSLSASPIITHFRWSSLVHHAFTANAHLFTSLPYPSLIPIPSIAYFPSESTSSDLLLRDAYDPSVPAKDIYTVIPGLLVVHIRKGDFVTHCTGLSNWGTTWNGMNRFPEFVDKFIPTSNADGSEAPPDVRAHYFKHCLPSISQIVEKVAEVIQSSEGEGMKYVYVMTNGKTEWAEELKGALRGMQGGMRWEKIATRRDLTLDWEQTFVSQAVDMVIGQRAQVFIGNGFSSLTSNIVMLRMANGFPPESNRFW